jgi:glycosyltransferase involved in cell wall biosynthesis
LIEDRFKRSPIEIIIVDDGSNDGTDALVERFAAQYQNIVFMNRGALKGIGSALRDGYNRATGEYILSSDADLSFTVDDMQALYVKIREGFDMVLGFKVEYRPIETGKESDKPSETKIKFLTSQLGNWLVRRLSGLGSLHNFNTNFRIMRRDVWQKLHTVEERHFFLFEVILRAKKADARITEIPVMFYTRKYGESKLNFFKEAPKYLVKLIRYSFFDRP